MYRIFNPIVRMGCCSSKRGFRRASTIKWPDPDTIDHVPCKNQIIKVKVVEVYDGDTFTILVPYDRSFLKLKLRILGVDAPELSIRGPERGTPMALLEQEAGKAVRDLVREKILGKEFDAKLVKWDKYGGRIDGELYIDENHTISEYLYIKGLAKMYNGGKKEVWREEELREMVKKR